MLEQQKTFLRICTSHNLLVFFFLLFSYEILIHNDLIHNDTKVGCFVIVFI